MGLPMGQTIVNSAFIGFNSLRDTEIWVASGPNNKSMRNAYLGTTATISSKNG